MQIYIEERWKLSLKAFWAFLFDSWLAFCPLQNQAISYAEKTVEQ